jgi:DNA-binding LacI/PurR family transcriptional regulator
MSGLRFLKITEQAAAYLREQIELERWTLTMPGRHELARELELSPQTVENALVLLEKEGFLEAQGQGKPRRITLPEGGKAPPPRLRIAMLLWRRRGPYGPYINELQHRLSEAGHEPFPTPQGLMELAMDLGRVQRLVARTKADAWIVHAASREIYDWFADQTFPVFGFLGSFRGLPIAATGPDFGPPFRECTEELLRLGHRRIVMIARPQRRLPEPEHPETEFLEALEAHGIKTSDYHFPLWKSNDRDGMHACLQTLFGATPPTAMIVQEAKVFVAVQQFLAARGLSVPGDVSLVCPDGDALLDWQIPTAAQFKWDSAPWVRRAVRWTDNISRGKEDRRQVLYPARFVAGGTIGPAPAGT